MIRRTLHALVMGLALWLGSCGVAAADAAPSSDWARQVLVLLRLPPGHFRANSDYSGGYGDELGRSARQRIASRLAKEQGLTLVTDWPMPLLGVDCYVMRVPENRSVEEVAALLSRDQRVSWAEPMQVFHAQGSAAAYNDPLFPAQPAMREWRLAELHEISTGQNVRVAVIDSRVDVAHPDLAGQVQLAEDFAPTHAGGAEQHGTGVAGIIAARAGNGIGIVGVAPRARLMALRACWQLPAPPSATVCDSLSLAKAIYFAITHNAQVINLSLSGPSAPLLAKLLDVAMARGVTVVSAVDTALPGGGFPASHAGVVAVADESMGAAAGGTFVAPGRGVPTTQPGGRWYLVNGSSYAAAEVSGLFALLRERSARPPGALALVSSRAGGGAIDACATLLRAVGPCGCTCARPATYAAFAGP
jgi:hypothetical protein